MAYDNTNSGALFRNEKKLDAKHPDYTGKLDVAGTEYWLSAWIKDGKSGKFMSLSVRPKQDKPADKHRGGRTQEEVERGDDIPF